MKKQHFAMMVSLLCVISLCVVFWPKGQALDSPIVIGGNLTLTGEFAYFGEQTLLGMKIAEAFANKQHDKKKVKFVFEDNQHDPSKAISGFKKLCEQNNARAIVSLYSPMCKVLREEAVLANVPLIATYTTADDMPNEWTFRDFPTIKELVVPLAEFSSKDGLRRRNASIVFQADFGVDAQSWFEKSVPSDGIMVEKQQVPFGVSPEVLRSVVAKVVAAEPDSVMLILSAKTLASAVNFLREQGYAGRILGIIMFDSPEVWSLIPASNQTEIYFTSVSIALDSSSESTAFTDEFVGAYGHAPDYMAVYGFTIGNYLIGAARKSSTGKEMMDAIQKTNLDSPRGRIAVRSDKSFTSEIVVYERHAEKNQRVEFAKSAVNE